jgi:hypothetical protein
LTLDGLVEWHHHRELAREARANIISEIRENHREMEAEQRALGKIEQQSQNLVDLVHKLEKNRNTRVRQFQYT